MQTEIAPAHTGPDRDHPSARPSAPVVVCHLVASNFLGGPEKQIIEHCTRLETSRWTPVIGSFRENRDVVAVTRAARKRGLATFLIDTRSPFSPLSIWQLRGELERLGVDLLITHGYKSNLVGLFASRPLGIPQVPFIRGYTAENWRIRRYETVDRFLVKRFPRVLCVSEITRSQLADSGVPAARIETVHNAVDAATEIRPTPFRDEFGIPKDAVVLAAAGRLSTEKGHRFLIAALGLLSSSPPVHLVLFGSGREESRLRTQAEALNLAPRVHFAGFRDGIPGYLAAADLVVNPSLTEGLPNVVLEAMAAAAPVVATSVGGVPEIVAPGRSGWLVPPGEPEALARAIEEALREPDRARDMGLEARREVQRRFSFEIQAERLTRVYADALG